MTLAFGSAYGGSTVVYTGTSLLPPERVLQRWNVPGLTLADVEQRARKYMAENNVHLLEEALLNENNRLFVEGCRRLRYRAAAVSGKPERMPRDRASVIWAVRTRRNKAPIGSSCRARSATEWRL